MTLKARMLGMTSTTYINASGLPAVEQITTARDQALLGRAIHHRFPDYYRYFATPSFLCRGIEMRNHNDLLGNVRGVDGIKTGYTETSGYNLVCVSPPRRQAHRGGRAGRNLECEARCPHARTDRSKFRRVRCNGRRRSSWRGKGTGQPRPSPPWLPRPRSRRRRRTASRSSSRGRSRRSRLQSPRLIPHFRRRTPRPRPACAAEIAAVQQDVDGNDVARDDCQHRFPAIATCRTQAEPAFLSLTSETFLAVASPPAASRWLACSAPRVGVCARGGNRTTHN